MSIYVYVFLSTRVSAKLEAKCVVVFACGIYGCLVL